jgi:transposase
VFEAFLQLLAETSKTAHVVQFFDSTVVRAHVSAAGAKGGRKIKTDFDGLPIAFHLTGGEVADTTQLEISLDIGPDIAPRAAITDKGYDSAANRAACRRRGIVPVIPYRENARNRPSFFPRLLYKTRARVEQTIGKLKRFKRVAMRCDKTQDSYGAFVAFACTPLARRIVSDESAVSGGRAGVRRRSL